MTRGAKDTRLTGRKPSRHVTEQIRDLHSEEVLSGVLDQDEEVAHLGQPSEDTAAEWAAATAAAPLWYLERVQIQPWISPEASFDPPEGRLSPNAVCDLLFRSCYLVRIPEE